MTDYNTSVRGVKTNTIQVRVEEYTFKRVLAIAHHYDSTMSDVVRLCVEIGLDQTEDILRKVKEARTIK